MFGTALPLADYLGKASLTSFSPPASIGISFRAEEARRAEQACLLLARAIGVLSSSFVSPARTLCVTLDISVWAIILNGHCRTEPGIPAGCLRAGTSWRAGAEETSRWTDGQGVHGGKVWELTWLRPSSIGPFKPEYQQLNRLETSLYRGTSNQSINNSTA